MRPSLMDGFGRKIDYLRVSVTDRCNLRCKYCMPGEKPVYAGPGELLTDEELVRFCRIFAGLGVTKIRITGGEPLVRENVPELVRRMKGICGIESVGITTNGCYLNRYADALIEAGVCSVNISLDTLDRETYAALTGQDALADVLSGIDRLKQSGILLKINCVPVSGINEEDICRMAQIAQKSGISVRFIELMPVGCGARHTGMRQEQLMDILEKRFGRAAAEGRSEADGPAEYVRFDGFSGRVGFISPLSHRFCGCCNRIRLTADGWLKLCLQYADGADLKTAVRRGADDGKIKQMIIEAVRSKPAGHSFGEEKKNADFRTMNRIGG